MFVVIAKEHSNRNPQMLEAWYTEWVVTETTEDLQKFQFHDLAYLSSGLQEQHAVWHVFHNVLSRTHISELWI